LRRAAQALLAAAAWAALVGPWMYRNERAFGSAQIAERGGVSLYTRGLLDTMTLEEYRGTFYAWAPRVRPLVGRLLGFSPDDFDRGGRLQRIPLEWQAPFADEDRLAGDEGRPQDAITYVRIGRGTLNRAVAEASARGETHPGTVADREVRDRGLELVRSHLGMHFALLLPMLWGLAPVVFPLLVATLILSAKRRRWDVAAFVLPTLALLMFTTLLSIFVHRYAIPAVPAAMIGAAFLAHTWWRSARLAPVRSRILSVVPR
jgi:hypothetical protein